MSDRKPESMEQSQSEKFKALARDLEADQNEARWDERLAKVAAHKLVSDEKTGTPKA